MTIRQSLVRNKRRNNVFLTIGLELSIGLIGLLLVMRVLGKKTMAELTPFDLIYTLILGGIVEGAIYEQSVHIGHVLFALSFWGTLIYVIEVIVQKQHRLSQVLKGIPSILVHDGQLNLTELAKNHIELEQLRSLLRSQNCFSLKEAKYVILETSGEVSVMKNKDVRSTLAVLLIDEGRIETKALESIEKSEEWLLEEINEKGYKKAEEIVYAEWSKEDGLYLVPYPKKANISMRIDG